MFYAHAIIMQNYIVLQLFMTCHTSVKYYIILHREYMVILHSCYPMRKNLVLQNRMTISKNMLRAE